MIRFLTQEESKKVSVEQLYDLSQSDLMNVLDTLPVGTIITGITNSPGTYGFGKYDFDTHIQKKHGYEKIPNRWTSTYEPIQFTEWYLSGHKIYDGQLAKIIKGKHQYYTPRFLIEDDVDQSLTQDTVKQGNYWVNKGKQGTHGKFKTKKQADAQRKAMFYHGYKG